MDFMSTRPPLLNARLTIALLKGSPTCNIAPRPYSTYSVNKQHGVFSHTKTEMVQRAQFLFLKGKYERNAKRLPCGPNPSSTVRRAQSTPAGCPAFPGGNAQQRAANALQGRGSRKANTFIVLSEEDKRTGQQQAQCQKAELKF